MSSRQRGCLPIGSAPSNRAFACELHASLQVLGSCSRSSRRLYRATWLVPAASKRYPRNLRMQGDRVIAGTSAQVPRLTREFSCLHQSRTHRRCFCTCHRRCQIQSMQTSRASSGHNPYPVASDCSVKAGDHPTTIIEMSSPLRKNVAEDRVR